MGINPVDITHKDCRSRRRAEDVTQAALATKLDVDAAALSRFELYGVPIPGDLTADDYLAALERLSDGVAA